MFLDSNGNSTSVGGTTSGVSAGSYTYLQLVKYLAPNIIPNPTARIGIALYQTGSSVTYDKYITMPKATYTSNHEPVSLIVGPSSSNPWIIVDKNGNTLLSANMTASTIPGATIS